MAITRTVKSSADSEQIKRNTELETRIQKVIEKATDQIVSKKTNNADDSSPDSMAKVIRDRFQEAEVARKDIEQRWLKDLRQYRGQYDPEVLSRIGKNRSKAYIRITRNKVKTVDSRLLDLLFPANGGRNWSIKPTVLPQLDQQTMQALLTTIQQSGTQNVTKDMLEVATTKIAEQRAVNMSTVIEDQLSQMAYRDIMRDILHSGNLYGTGILKGPMVMLGKSRQYQQVQDDKGSTKWELEVTDQLLPYIESVPVWDFYPDMTATKLEDCRFIIQRHKMSKKQLLELSKRTDFMSDRISSYIENQKDGDWEDKYFDTNLKEIGDRSSGAFNEKKSGRKYELLEYWGYMDASDLEDIGADVPDNLKGEVEIASNVWILGNKIIKASVSHLSEIQWPFYVYYYDKDETSIFGEGIPSILRDVQELINSSFRAMLDNAAITAGPQFEVNVDMLAEDEDPTDIYPLKVWLRTGEGADAAQEAVRVKNVTSHTPEFLQMCQAFENYADEVTTIPRYMWGDNTPGISRTSSGMSMLMGSANITIKDQVKNCDDGITSKFIDGMYHWNMKFNTDPDIKGDFDIIAEGTTSLIAKEVYSQSLMQFAQMSASPIYQPLVRSDSILRAIADALDLSDKNLVLSQQEVQANQQAAQQQQAQERDFMLRMTETARKFGTSPADMIASMQQAYSDKQNMMQQAAQQSNQAAPAPAGAQPNE